MFLSIMFMCLSYFYSSSFAQSNEIVPLLVQDFESPNVDIWGTGKCRRPGRPGATNYFCNLCSSGSSSAADINNWYANNWYATAKSLFYSQCDSLEIIKTGDWSSTNPNLGSAYLRPDGSTWNSTWADPMGKGGQYVLGMGGRNDKGYVGGADLLFMSFDTKGKTLINVAFDLSPTKYMACGSMSVTDFAAQMRVSVHNEDSFPAQYCSTYSTPFAPPQYVYAPRHPECPYTFSNTYNETTTHAKCFEFYWTRVEVSFNLTNAVDDRITLIITGGLDYSSYVAIDNIVIVSADEITFTTTREPSSAAPTSPTPPTPAPPPPPTPPPTLSPTPDPKITPQQTPAITTTLFSSFSATTAPSTVSMFVNPPTSRVPVVVAATLTGSVLLLLLVVLVIVFFVRKRRLAAANDQFQTSGMLTVPELPRDGGTSQRSRRQSRHRSRRQSHSFSPKNSVKNLNQLRVAPADMYVQSVEIRRPPAAAVQVAHPYGDLELIPPRPPQQQQPQQQHYCNYPHEVVPEPGYPPLPHAQPHQSNYRQPIRAPTSNYAPAVVQPGSAPGYALFSEPTMAGKQYR